MDDDDEGEDECLILSSTGKNKTERDRQNKRRIG